MAQQYKIDKVEKLKTNLQEKKNIILTDYSGIRVAELDELRMQLRDKGIDYRVIKNNLFKRALKEAGYGEMDEFIKGPIAVAFTNDEIGETVKILKDFEKKQEKFSYSVGIMNNELYNEEQVKRIADIPSKEVLLAQIASLINAPVTNLAMVLKQTVSNLARGIKAVAEQNAE